MILGSHNSMSYLKPAKWWMKPFNFMAKCQKKTIEQQYDDYGVRVFDLRISYDGRIPQFKHGLVRYKGDVEAVLSYLNAKSNVQVRLLLEKSSGKENSQELNFIKDCRKWEDRYKNIQFFAANRKHDWKKLYNFPDKEKQIEHWYSSMQGNKLNDLFPEKWAKKHNKKVTTDKEILMLDFVEIR